MYNEKRFKLNPEPVREEDLPTLDDLNREVRKKMEMAAKQRLEKNPLPDEKEKELGKYREDINPLMRRAIFRLREKGYPATGESSFNDNCLELFFEDDQEFKKEDTDKIKANLKSHDVEFIVEPRSLKLTLSNSKRESINLLASEIVVFWTNVVDNLPRREEKPAPPVNTSAAKEFRKKYTT